jgi:hypothetical protein
MAKMLTCAVLILLFSSVVGGGRALGGAEPGGGAGPGAGEAAALTAEGVVDGEGLGKDLEILRRAYEALHPGLYRYSTPEEIDERFAELGKAAAAAGMPLRDVYLGLTRLLASIQCGHTYPNFFNQSERIAGALFTGKNRLPFTFRWIQRRMIVTRNMSGASELAAGVEVIAINTVSPAKILKRMMPLARADGGNDFKRMAYLEVRGDDRIEAFDVLLPLLHPEWSGEFELMLRDPVSGEESTVRVAAQSEADRAALVAEREKRVMAGEPVWEFTMHEGGVACMRMPTWGLYKGDWDWAGWINARMDEAVAAGSQALIVDLRGNEGGLDCGDVIVSRVIERDLVQSGRTRYVCYRKTPADLDAMLDTWDDSFRDRTAETSEAAAPPLLAGNGRVFYRLAEEENRTAKTIKKTGTRFGGRLIVLVDSVCSSATFQFALMVQQAKLGLIVGEPTGGNQRGLNGGAFFFLRLPNTGLEVDVPLISYVMEGAEPPNAGVTPDVLVEVTPGDIRAGVDRPLSEALRLGRAR